jgi:hypothetical protein
MVNDPDDVMMFAKFDFEQFDGFGSCNDESVMFYTGRRMEPHNSALQYSACMLYVFITCLPFTANRLKVISVFSEIIMVDKRFRQLKR